MGHRWTVSRRGADVRPSVANCDEASGIPVTYGGEDVKLTSHCINNTIRIQALFNRCKLPYKSCLSLTGKAWLALPQLLQNTKD